MKTEELYRVVAPLSAGELTVVNGKVSDVEGAAPIVKYMRGWTMQQVRAYCIRRRWALERVQ